MKDRRLRVLPLDAIHGHVRELLDYVRRQPDLSFPLTPIGCGLTGYRPEQIAPMFSHAPANVILPDACRAVLLAAVPPG